MAGRARCARFAAVLTTASSRRAGCAMRLPTSASRCTASLPRSTSSGQGNGVAAWPLPPAPRAALPASRCAPGPGPLAPAAGWLLPRERRPGPRGRLEAVGHPRRGRRAQGAREAQVPSEPGPVASAVLGGPSLRASRVGRAPRPVVAVADGGCAQQRVPGSLRLSSPAWQSTSVSARCRPAMVGR